MFDPDAIDLQRTDDWLQARVGKFTASNFGKLMTMPVGKGRSWDSATPGKSFDTYVREVVTERLTGHPCESFEGNKDTEWGNLHESDAFAAFREKFGHDVEPSPFVALNGWAGASPDGLIEGGGVLELKCPANPKYHMAALLDLEVTRAAYVWQFEGEMLCTGRSWGYWCSYDPRFPEPQRLVGIRIGANDEQRHKLTERLNLAEERARTMLDKITAP